MIKVSVFYPRVEGARFDFGYYADTHAHLVQKLLGDALQKIEVDNVVSGAAPTDVPRFVAVLHLYFLTLEDFRSSFGPNAAAFRADMPNYTDLKPEVQISEVFAPT